MFFYSEQRTRLSEKSVTYFYIPCSEFIPAFHPAFHIQKNFFNDSSPSAPFQTPNPGPGSVFNPGNSSTFSISGVDSASGVSVPSIAVADQSGLTVVLNGIPNNNNNINPPPAIVTDIPDWMATPQNLDAMVSKLRTTAQNSGRYFVNPSKNLNNVGDYTTGTGITFCEGDCTAGVDGGVCTRA